MSASSIVLDHEGKSAGLTAERNPDAGSVVDCASCNETKPALDFGPDKRRTNGRSAKCRDCVRGIRDAFYAAHPERKLTRSAAQRELGSKWYARNRERLSAKFKVAKLKSYGLTPDTYAAVLATQGGGCAICSSTDPGRNGSRFLVDHDHATGAMRGLLCHSCNVGLGAFKDNTTSLSEAVDYLRRSR